MEDSNSSSSWLLMIEFLHQGKPEPVSTRSHSGRCLHLSAAERWVAGHCGERPDHTQGATFSSWPAGRDFDRRSGRGWCSRGAAQEAGAGWGHGAASGSRSTRRQVAFARGAQAFRSLLTAAEQPLHVMGVVSADLHCPAQLPGEGVCCPPPPPPVRLPAADFCPRSPSWRVPGPLQPGPPMAPAPLLCWAHSLR